MALRCLRCWIRPARSFGALRRNREPAPLKTLLDNSAKGGMTMQEPSLEDLSRRMERLERENRWWRFGAGLGVVPMVMVLLLGAGRSIPAEITAQKFVVLDSDGRRRIELGEDVNTGFGLQVFGENGGSRARLMVRHLYDDLPYL